MPNAESTPAINSFADYVFDTYISVDSQYPPEMWARFPVDMAYPMTTNGAEAFHRHFKDCFKFAHPNIFAFTRELLSLQEETYVKLHSGNYCRAKRSAASRRLQHINSVCAQYKEGCISRGDFLRQIAFKFLPIGV